MSITTWWQRSTTLAVLTAPGSSQTLHYISLLVHIYVSHVSLSLYLGLRKVSFRKDARNYLTDIAALNEAGTFQEASGVATYEKTVEKCVDLALDTLISRAKALERTPVNMQAIVSV
ncbi:hypothetical protein EDD85DRAFT_948013 [Armillaria nabsnona]|nr:hypothetical protein EDD85DRAFT_948013 [Armillaria nabsnona]